jgi:hypothetical protein
MPTAPSIAPTIAPTMLKRRLRTLTLATLVTLSACGGKSCSCISPIKGGFPAAERHDNAIQVRATPALFAFLGDKGANLVTSLLGGNTINVPPSCSGNEICCGNPAPMCRIQLTPQKLGLSPTPPDVVKLAFTTQVKTLDKLPVTYSASIFGTAKCLVSIDTTAGTAGHTDIDIDGDLQFSVEKTSDLTRVTLANAAVANLDGSMITLESQPGDFLCTVANFGPIKSFLVGAIGSALTSNLGGLVDGQLCMKCTTQDDCNSFATACTNGQCMEADGKTCVQELGLEGRLDVGAGLASFSPGLTAGTDIIAAAGGYAGVDTGLSLGLLGGAQSDPHSSCVPMVAAPVTPPVAQSQTFFTDVLPDRATPYHLGIGVHVSELDNIGYGVFDGGGLCLNIGTKSVALLSTKTLGLVIPSLVDLVHVADAPMLLAMHPQNPPTFTMGAGTFKPGANGTVVVDDPLLWVSIPSLSIDFFAFTDDRYVRIMTLTADVMLGVSLTTDGSGKIVPVFGDTTHAFKNVVVTHSDLLAESPASLAKAFPMLLSVAIAQIAGAVGSIALPSLAGMNIEPIAITSTDPGADGTNQFLAIFANLAVAASPSQLSLQTTATLQKLELPSTREFAVSARGATRPTAWLALGASNPDAEFSYAVDGGPWSAFTTATSLGVSDEQLWMQGRHFVDVRARLRDRPSTLDATPARVEFLVDTVPPSGSFDIAGGELQVDAHDLVSPADKLQLRVSSDDGASFSAWQPSGRVQLARGVATASVRVQARDEAGNIGELALTSASGGGCAIGHGSDAKPSLLLFAALALLFWRSRKSVWIGCFALFYGIGLAGCGGLGKGDFEDPTDEIGRYSDIAADKDGVFHLSAYDDTTGDLAYAVVSDPKQQIGWQYVDGIDPTSAVAKKDGYRRGVTDPGPDVGLYTSLALDKSGRPRIAYYDATDGALKFALGPHPFTSYTIDGGTTTAPVGPYAALSLDGNDVPSVAYLATGLGDGTSGFHGELRVAVAHNATPGAGDWTITKVATTAISCAGRCATTQACVVTAMVNGMANTNPAYSTCVAVDAMPCATACTTSQACIMATCTAMLPTPGAVDLVEGTGLFAQALRDKSGALELVFYDHDQGALMLATQSGGAWKTTILDGGTSGADVGQFASAAVADDGSIHVAYVDAVAHALRYQHVAGGAPQAMPDVVDDGTRAGDNPHDVGAGANLVLDNGAPRIVYQDQTTADLELATGAPMWKHSDVQTGIAGYGFYPKQITVKGQRWLMQFVYDRQNGPQPPLGTLQLATMN